MREEGSPSPPTALHAGLAWAGLVHDPLWMPAHPRCWCLQDSLTRCSRLKPGTPDNKTGQRRPSPVRQKAVLAALVHPEAPASRVKHKQRTPGIPERASETIQARAVPCTTSIGDPRTCETYRRQPPTPQTYRLSRGLGLSTGTSTKLLRQF